MIRFGFRFIALMLLLAGTVSCEEKEENTYFGNIENLYAQPLPVIQKAIQGKWKIVYLKGGLMANRVQYLDNHFVEFTADKQYIYSYPTKSDTAKFEWSKGVSYYTSVDFMYIMVFPELHTTPLVMEKFYNDTLIFYQYQVADFEYSYCIKSN